MLSKPLVEGWAQDCSNSNVFLKPLFRGNFDPFVNNANLGANDKWKTPFLSVISITRLQQKEKLHYNFDVSKSRG